MTSKDDITVGGYLLERLAQLGVQSVFGVPGDFNLGFLDLVDDHPKLEWIGNCNELNASYAADGYARVKPKSVGALITTFGVGELSAVNGIAGAFSEHIPVVHIVGVPSTAQQKSKPMLHHTLGDGRYDAYYTAAQQFAVSWAFLNDTHTAAAEIDRVITACITRARPVYLMLPTDIAYERIPKGSLETGPLVRQPPEVDTAIEDFVIDEIVKLVKEAGSSVAILADSCAIRHHCEDELLELIKETGYPVYCAPMGKTVVPEDYERYGGIYIGSITPPEVKQAVESTKLILSVGLLNSDFNTGGFTYRIEPTSTVQLHSDHTKIQYAMFPDVGMKHLLPKLTSALRDLKSSAVSVAVPPFKATIPSPNDDPLHPIISQAYFWPRMAAFFKPKDVIVAETGTSSFGVLGVPFPKDSIFVSQILWGSIGYTVGATLGAALGARERGLGRTILFVGDGSLQLTVQELSTMMKCGLAPIVFVLNNSGYTIERYLHGKTRAYNDIVNWKWTQLLEVLGPDAKPAPKSYTVNNKTELEELLDDPDFAKAERMQLVEVMMDKFDAPEALQRTAELSTKANKYAQ
ncbi:pyruvate decarboxylase [Vararia minispora EC-137]|uniref:Pyruvate decarboxylase n=1 Tax=Vararia minispora EC-137 TaxID=1314806 RepID=A0ACB8QTM3_9AGAM|nr:pyruvate decarboxylase [Vararia minispora EC-137]